jgi:hypothetical protein
MEEKVILKRPPKSPALAGILAFFLPTTGALYNGQPLKFFIYLIVFGGLISLQPSGAQPFTAFLLVGFLCYQFFEAIQTAKNINKRALNLKEEEVPEVEEIPEFVKTGSIFWGIVIMLIGFVLLLANFEVLNYRTLGEFWPIAVVVIGIKLVTDYYKKQKEEQIAEEETVEEENDN